MIGDHVAFTFERPHRIGSVCGPGCEQCTPDSELTDRFGEAVPQQPMVILAEATREDWLRGLREVGGTPGHGYGYYYFISTD